MEQILRIRDLIQRYHMGVITIAELEELDSWRSLNPENEVKFKTLIDNWELQRKLRLKYKTQEQAPTYDFNKKQVSKAKIRTLGWRRIIGTAAAIIIIAVSAYLLTHLNTPPSKDISTRFPINATVDKLPGYNNATLTLSDGSVVELDKVKPGSLIAKQGNSSVRKMEDGKLIYETGKSSVSIKFNRLETPAGGQYPIVLDDGTKIFIGSVSRLDFPEKFAADKRVVTFSGQGYFEVKHDALRPFFVIINGQQIRVTGTKFVINSYTDEPYTTTTLVEGGIKLSKSSQDRYAAIPTLAVDPKAIDVRPGQAVIYDTISKGQKLDKNADVEATVAFVDGKFVLNGTNLPTIMRQISRWYDVQIEYEKGFNPEDIEISGTFSKNQKLSQIINILKHLGVKAHQEGNKLIVGVL